MDPVEYMETIIQGMVRRRHALASLSQAEKENHFKSLAKAHNPVIEDDEIQEFWNAQSNRV